MTPQRAVGWRTLPRRLRRTLTALLVVVILVAVGVTTYRTLRPAEMLNRTGGPLPSPEVAESIQYGELRSAPLIVEGRLRVYAEARRVFADTPVTARRENTPHWAYRRWPAEVVGVLAIERTPFGGLRSVIVTKWSDGAVAALNAETGEVIWQSRVEPAATDTYHGRRTGSQTVYEPDGLYRTASAIDGRPIVIVAGKDMAVAFDPWLGTQRWSQTFTIHPGCHDVDWTGETTYVVKDRCATPAVLEIFDAANGTWLNVWRPTGASAGPGKEADWYVEPASCELGRSGCQLFKASPTAEVVGFAAAANGLGTITPSYYKLGRDGKVAVEPHADKDNAFVIGDVLVEQVQTDYIWATSRSTGQRLWMSEVAGTMIYADERIVYVVNREWQLLVLNLITGAVTGSTELRIRPEDRWMFRRSYVHSAFVVVERLNSGREADVDEKYYFTDAPIVLVGVD
jgi:outer membrane protein assembly factor BamB